MHIEDFPILAQHVHGHPLVYLDNAATTQKPACVTQAIVDAYNTWNANIHRGTHHLSVVATEKHEQARAAVAAFIGAADPNEIVFTRGTTESINLLAFSFGEAFIRPGDEIIVSALEHHSNIVPWQMLCERKNAVLRVIPLREDLTLDMAAAAKLFTPRTKLLSVAQVSNVLGTVQPVAELIRMAHSHGVPVCVDGAQAAPHIPVDVQALGCDFYVCSGHKVYGPTGIGVLYGRRALLEQLPPYQGGGEMIAHVRWSGTTYNGLPYRFEAGTPDYVGSYALGIALKYVQSVGIDVIRAHEDALIAYAEQQLHTVTGVRVYADGQPKAGALSFNVYTPDGTLVHPFDIGTLLDHQGIAVRTGHHCAEPLIDHLGVPGTVRISVALYNTQADIDAFVAALRRAISMLV